MTKDNTTSTPGGIIKSDNTSSSPLELDNIVRNIRMVSVVIYCVIFIVGTLGNCLVIYVTGFRMKRTVNSVWFLNLALADCFFTAFLIFWIISASQGNHWPFGAFMCKLFNFVVVVNMFASIFLLTVISVDRCLSIWVVVWAQNKRTVRKAQLISAAVWVAAVVCSIPYATFRVLKTKGEKTYCSSSGSKSQYWSLGIFRFVMGFFVPFMVILVSYTAISVRAGRVQRTRRHRSRRIIFSIIFAFFICWLPFHVVHLIELNGAPQGLQRIIRIVGPLTISLAFANSCLNPILYVFLCDEFQKKLKQSICLVLESALAEDHLSFMSSRSMSSHFTWSSRKSESSAPVEKSTTTSSKCPETQVFNGERETTSAD